MQFSIEQVEQIVKAALKPVLDESNQRLKKLEDITLQIMEILEKMSQDGTQNTLKQQTLKNSVSTAVLAKHQQTGQTQTNLKDKKVEHQKERDKPIQSTNIKDKEKEKDNEKGLNTSKSNTQLQTVNMKRNSVALTQSIVQAPVHKQEETNKLQKTVTNLIKTDQQKMHTRPRTSTTIEQQNMVGSQKKGPTENKVNTKQVQKQPNQQEVVKKDLIQSNNQYKDTQPQPIQNQIQQTEFQQQPQQEENNKETTIEQFALQIEECLDSDFNLLEDSPKRKSMIQINFSNKALDDISLINRLKQIGKDNPQVSQQIIEELIDSFPQTNNLDKQFIEQELQKQIDELNQDKIANDKAIEELLNNSKGQDGQPLQSFKLKDWMESWIKGTFELVNVDDLLRLDDPSQELKDIMEVWLAISNSNIIRSNNDIQFWKSVQIYLDENQFNLAIYISFIVQQSRLIGKLEKYLLKYPHIIDNDIYEKIDVLSGVLSYIFKSMCKHFGIIGDPASSVSRIWFILEKQKFKLQQKVNDLKLIVQEFKKEFYK